MTTEMLQTTRRLSPWALALATVCCTAPVGAQSISITTGGISPHGGSHLIAGTQFPWVDRFGNVVANLTGGFQVSAYPPVHASSITVTVNGQPTAVTENPNNISVGSWVLAGSLSVGSTATTYQVSISYSKPGVNIYVTNPNPIPWQIYAVYPYTVWNGSYGDTAHDDVVNTTSNLVFIAGGAGGGNDVLTSFGSVPYPPGNGSARQIFNGFTAWAPPNVNDYPPITVGIMQTEEAGTVLGSVTCYQVGMPYYTETLYFVKVPGVQDLPWWDGNPNGLPTYYDTPAQHSIQGDTPSNILGSLEWIYGSPVSGNSAGLAVNDSPYMTLLNNYAPGGGFAYDWGTSPGPPRALGGQSPVDSFTDILVASSGDAPGIYVPIYGYFDWSVTFAGSLPANLVWSGGSVSSGGTHPSTQPVTDSSRGPANNMETTNFH